MKSQNPGKARMACAAAVVLLLAAAVSFAGGKGEAGAGGAAAKLPISVGFSVPDLNGDPMGKWVQEKLGASITIVNTEGDKLKLLATAGNLPDVFEVELGNAFFNQLKLDGLIRSIPDAAIARYPAVKKYVENNEAIQAFHKFSGRYYTLPREADVDSPPKDVQAPFYYRADWLKKLNLPVPKTAQDLYTVLKAFTTQDPDGNGKADTTGMTGWLWQVHFIPWADIYSWVKEDGVWIPGYISKGVPDALAFYSRLYKEKILDPEFAVAKARDQFFAGRVGMINANGDMYWLWNNITVGFAQANPGVNAMEAVKLLPPISRDAASQPVWPRKLNTSGSAFSAKATDEKVDRILSLFEWTLSPEGRDFALYGFKDKDYMLKDGKAVSILPNKETEYNRQKPLWEVYPSDGFFGLVRWNAAAATELLNPIYPRSIVALSKDMNTMLSKNLAPVNVLVETLSTPEKDKYNVGLDAVETEFGRIVSSADAVSEFAVYKKKLLDVNGLQKVIDEVNAVIKAQGLDK